MTAKKAIEILEYIILYVEQPGDPSDEHDAIRLGIEGLKQFQKARPGGIISSWVLLPGETAE